MITSVETQESEDVLTFSNFRCSVSNFSVADETVDITVSGTVRANRDMKDLKIWVEIDDTPYLASGIPAPPDASGAYNYAGGRVLGLPLLKQAILFIKEQTLTLFIYKSLLHFFKISKSETTKSGRF